VRGPTGCRYLADERQKSYVRDGWNITGDSFMQDEAGYFYFMARSDDMIISAGYNIAGPEVEAALLTCNEVIECAVIGAPDTERGQIVQQFEKRLLDEEAHYLMTLQWHRIIPHSAKVHGWTITPSHYLNNTLDTVWLSQ